MESNYIEYEVTKQDYIDFVQCDLKRTKSRRFSSAFRFLVLTGILFILRLGAIGFHLYLIVFLVVVISIGILSKTRFNASMIIRSRLRSGGVEQQYFSRHRLELKADGIELQYGTICVQRLYAGIHKIVEYPKGIAVYCSQLEVDIIPSTAFVDARQRGDFLNNLQSKISQAKNIGISDQSVEEQKQAADYVLEYTWDESGFIDAMTRGGRLIYTTRLGWPVRQIFYTLIGFVLVSFSIMNFIMLLAEDGLQQSGLWIVSAFILCFGILFLSSLIITFSPLAKKLYRRRIDNGVITRDFFNPQVLCFKADRITELRRMNTNDVMYDKVHCVKHDADGKYSILKGMRILVIPITAFHSDEQKQDIISYINRKIKGKDY